jgi:membrane protein involved in colicin uptake
MYIPRAEDPDEALAAAVAAAVKAEAAKAAEEAKAAAVEEAKAAIAKVPVGEIVGAGEFASNFLRGLGVHTVVAENTPGATSLAVAGVLVFLLAASVGIWLFRRKNARRAPPKDRGEA